MSPMEHHPLLRSKIFIGVVLVAALSLLLAWIAEGPLIAIRNVDPTTGNAILMNASAANASGSNQKFVPGNFEPSQLVEEVWEEKVIPWVNENRIALSELQKAIASDEQSAKQEYGFQSGGETYNFLISGDATVTAVDTSTPVGVVQVMLPDVDDQDVQLLVGPLVIGTALRDTLPFLSLNHFTNQMQYADVAKALNDRALENSFGDIDLSNLVGKKLYFTGAFSMPPSGPYKVIPTDIEVLP